MVKKEYKRMSIKETTQITRQLNAIYKAAHLLQEHFVDKNILRLVVKKSPTGESTHYFFHSQDDKVEVSC
ncbi:hypothetical protein [Streptococcus parasuis]|uniref:hypothetical protein n=1 Tax=Streptococcus parasuis TaxID=1501662 RepID=UPI0028990F6B|nr:hypothetical protein [Streptococcus parasuis]